MNMVEVTMRFRKSLTAVALSAALGLASVGPAMAAGPNRGAVAPEVGPSQGGLIGTACVNSSGTKLKGNAVSAVPDTAFPGGYIVRFSASVRSCVYAATLGLCGSSGVEQGGEIQATAAAIDPRGVYVYTRNSSGTPTPRSFNLIVRCD